MKPMGRWLGVSVAIYLLIGSAFGSIAWARNFGGGATQMGWDPKPRQMDPVKVGQDEEKVRHDLSQIAQYKKDFQKQFLGLKTQRAEALKSKNKDQRGEPKQESGRKHHSKHLHVEGSQ